LLETQVVSLVEVRGTNNSLVHPRGAVGVVTRTPAVAGEKFLVLSGEIPWPEVSAWRKVLHHDFEHALSGTRLPERPDYKAANGFLVKARRGMASQ